MILTPRFPRQGSRGPGSPASTVLSGRYDSLPLVPPHFVSFAWRYHSLRLSSFLPSGSTSALGPGGSWYRHLPRRSLKNGNDRASHVPGEPRLCLCPALRPRQDRSHQATLGAPARPPLRPRRRLLQVVSLEAQSHGLGTRCLRFAGRITPPPRKTRFRLPAKLYRTGFLPVGFQRKVSEQISYMAHPPFPSLVAQGP